jgi:hypothetical protein
LSIIAEMIRTRMDKPVPLPNFINSFKRLRT